MRGRPGLSGVSRFDPGSPPRMRGRRLVVATGDRDDGLTPAYAGKTPPQRATTVRSSAHPRVCGEDGAVGGKQASSLGSPPRMRGRPEGVWGCICSPGLTPAYAGKTRAGRGLLLPRWAHPRVCGEDRSIVKGIMDRTGSPPRMRGRRRRSSGRWRGRGLTPAYAGKTRPAWGQGPPGWAHPRVCGEDCCCVYARSGTRGSPPRMRGRLKKELDQ